MGVSDGNRTGACDTNFDRKGSRLMKSELIVMLTYKDRTLENAYRIFEECRDTKANIWGIKEEGIPFREMKALYAFMKDCGKTTVLEAVAYTEDKCVMCAKMAHDCGCDVLMGTIFFDSVNEYCREHDLKYMPFVGKVTCRPSILEGGIEEMIEQANRYLDKGIHGFDLLGYRYVGNTLLLSKEFISRVDAPVCLAGSIDSYERLDEVKAYNPWAFTIGGAFFENKFGRAYSEQINNIYDYITA